MTTSTTSSATSSRRGAKPRPADRTAHKPLVPLTVDHWRAWSRLLVLDSGERWEPEEFQCLAAEDLLEGDAAEVWLIIPEGNAKTTLLSGFALYHSAHVNSAAVAMAAASRDQTGLLLNQGAGFVRRTPGLEKRFRIFEGYRRIQCHRTRGIIQVFAADDRTGDGIIPTLALLEELHRHRDLRLYRTWRGKLDKRQDVRAKLAAISTAGDAGAEFETTRARLLAEATDVKTAGAYTRAASAGAVIHDYSVPEGADTDDIALVKAANPLKAITPAMLAAKRDSPTMTTAHWRRFVCNQSVRGDFSAVSRIEWDAAATDEQIPAGQPVYAGLDIGWKWDTTAVWPIWVPALDKRLLGQPEIITPPRDGTSLEPRRIHEALRTTHDRNPIEVLVVDGAVGGEVIADWAQTELGCRVVVHSNGHRAQCLAFERWMEGLREGWLHHPGHPEGTAHVLNARARILPDGRSRFDRPVSTRSAADLQDQRVIDALSAASGAHSVAVGDLRAEPAPVVQAPTAVLI